MTTQKTPAPFSVTTLILLTASFMLLIPFCTPRDNTDAQDGTRSRLQLFTDYGTGCQYVRGGAFGALTPRLDINGQPLCDPALRK